MNPHIVDISEEEKWREEGEKEYSSDNFVSEFMNDHNGGTPRWLRSAFLTEEERIKTILEYMRGIENKLHSQRASLSEKWREEFDKKFGFHTEPETYLTNRGIENAKLKSIKSFIEELLSSQRKSLEEKVPMGLSQWREYGKNLLKKRKNAK